MTVLTTIALVCASLSASIAADGGGGGGAWPNAPLSTSGRWMVDAAGVNVAYAGVNWPAHLEAMVPEGLQYASVEAIVGKVKSLGMNVVRLTYATQMVDDLFAAAPGGGEGPDVDLQTTFVNALGLENGTAVLNRVLEKNPAFKATTTRLQVFDAVAAECLRQQIYLHLDNHVSRAKWCCDVDDGNTWWGDTFFDAGNWTRGLSYMASRAKARWPAVTSLSLRNELRPPLTNQTLLQASYNWQTWYEHMRAGAAAIHAAHPDALVFVGGIDGDMTLQPVVEGTPLLPGTASFVRDDFAPGFARRLVLELHTYNFFRLPNCSALTAQLLGFGFEAEAFPSSSAAFAVALTEFGFAQDATTWRDDAAYAACVESSFLPAHAAAGWMIWALGGSYYVRQGVHDYDETWGLLTHDWAAWRSPAHVDGALVPLVGRTLAAAAAAGGVGGGGGGGNATSDGGGGSKSGAPRSYWPLRPLIYLLGFTVCFSSVALMTMMVVF